MKGMFKKVEKVTAIFCALIIVGIANILLKIRYLWLLMRKRDPRKMIDAIASDIREKCTEEETEALMTALFWPMKV